jgi:predicted DNA-binding transcriptional regulator AlpA
MEHQKMPQDLLSPREVAARADCNLSYVYGLISKGKLPVVRLADRVFVRARDYEAWFARYSVNRHSTPQADGEPLPAV